MHNTVPACPRFHSPASALQQGGTRDQHPFPGISGTVSTGHCPQAGHRAVGLFSLSKQMGAAQHPLTTLFLIGIAWRTGACPAEPSQQVSAFGMSLAVTGHRAGTTEPIFPRASITFQASDSPFSTSSSSVWMSQCQQICFLADSPF